MKDIIKKIKNWIITKILNYWHRGHILDSLRYAILVDKEKEDSHDR